MTSSYVIKDEKGFVKYNTRFGDYNENSYFEGFTSIPETFFSSEYRAKLEAELCGLEQYKVVSI
ncbi:hypothetical protein LS684_04310 [Cytobacillus spongiae]|uniref:hypothetical protein n=1 Tax=Cytobacillus spongiae TaxID=2901381 RepID=UPI001F406183|nr:hypothetical protein [Cytobacillus spongiae]UII56694.1 hypothetical protein LS684_04310 [Cytobacillus spongiae]